MKINDQRGFTLVEILLSLVVLLAVAAAVYYAVQHHRTTAKNPSTATLSTSPISNDVSVVTTTLGKAPLDLQTAALALMKSNNCLNASGQLVAVDGTTTSDPSTSTVYYIPNKAAQTIDCNSFAMYSYSGGQWNFDFAGQADLGCSQLKKYVVPEQLVKSVERSSTPVCTDSKGNQITYTN